MELEKERQGLGLSLAGNRDRSRLSIFVVGLHPGGPAARDGRIRVGDELLEVTCDVMTSWQQFDRTMRHIYFVIVFLSFMTLIILERVSALSLQKQVIVKGLKSAC